MKLINKVSSFIMHKSFFSLFLGLVSVFYLYDTNFSKVNFSLVVRSLIFSVFFVMFVFLISWLITKKIKLSVFISIWLSLLFFSYGHVYNFIVKIDLLNKVAHHRFLLPVYTALLILGLLFVIRKNEAVEQLTPIFNIIGIYFMVSIAFSIASQAYLNFRDETQPIEQLIEHYDLQSYADEMVLPQFPPDIYFIVLDNYGRQDVLQEGFGFNNSHFLDSLEQIGFYIPHCNQSNYAITTLSVSSMLQMNYIDEFGDQIVREDMNWRTFSSFIRHNNVRLTLEDLKYKTVVFETPISWMNIPDGTVYFRKPENFFAPLIDFDRLNPFEKLFINTTAIRPINVYLPHQSIEPNDGELVPAHSKYSYELMKYTLELIPEIPNIEGPKFVYIHLLTTHYPYLVDEKGNFRYLESTDGYISAVKFINDKLLGIIPSLIENSSTPPIIILQADHGPTYQKQQFRMQPLAAYYLPNQGDKGFYSTITPVNLFRQIFNNYFEANFVLKNDESYFSTTNDPYNLIEIPNDLSECQVDR